MPVAIPHINIAGIQLPEPPADPPTQQNMLEAHCLVSRVANHFESGCLHDVHDLPRAQLYKHNILTSVANANAVAPPPPMPADPAPIPDIQQIVQEAIQQALQPIYQRLEGMDQRLDGMQETLREMQGTLREVRDTAYQAYNCARGPGTAIPFKILPFYRDDGLEELPQNLQRFPLPPLTHAGAVNNLPARELNRYIARYRIRHDDMPDRATKVQRLKAHIGCTDM
ncbi:hypothetical protein BDN67DRAFT_1005615 [Paxillus ammoniavirescens]|nr:hypothetical protein BDN67DRAFT_1005615 [Paxillus ammoniavirescens]